MTGYSATVQVRPDRPAGIADEQIDHVAELLAVHHGSFSTDAAGTWTATFSVIADDAHAAISAALETARRVTEQASLSPGSVVRLEAVQEDVLDEELAEPNLPDLVSGPEIAEMLGVSRQRVHQLATENRHFPAPLYRLGVGSLWVRQAIEQFDHEWERKPGRPRASGHGHSLSAAARQE